jgi:hypothetical protein
MKVFSFRNTRIIILLGILAAALIYTQEQQRSTTSWYKPIEVVIFPINGDAGTDTAEYIASLSAADFKDIDQFFATGSRQYALTAEQPIITRLATAIEAQPPEPPADRSSTLSVIWWSLKLRYWAWKHTPDNVSNKNRIRLFVLYHQADGNQSLAHSLGLQKGLIGVIHAYANNRQAKQNTVVMAHEILHTVGATDKYDAANLPLYPAGYAEPDLEPLHPQRFAEIMAGRIAMDTNNARMPASLRATRVGEQTAREINWIK